MYRYPHPFEDCRDIVLSLDLSTPLSFRPYKSLLVRVCIHDGHQIALL
jgi:hypothetical protein